MAFILEGSSSAAARESHERMTMAGVHLRIGLDTAGAETNRGACPDAPIRAGRGIARCRVPAADATLRRSRFEWHAVCARRHHDLPH